MARSRVATTVWLVGQPNSEPIMRAKLPSRGDVLNVFFLLQQLRKENCSRQFRSHCPRGAVFLEGRDYPKDDGKKRR